MVGKIFEAILTNKLVSHLEDHEFLNNSQHGFRKNRSWLTRLLKFLRLLSINDANNYKIIDIIYLDF